MRELAALYYCEEHMRVMNFRGKESTQSHFMEVE